MWTITHLLWWVCRVHARQWLINSYQDKYTDGTDVYSMITTNKAYEG